MTNVSKVTWIALIYGLLMIGVVAAKATGHIHLSWWIVTAPIWAPVAIVIIGALVMIVGFTGMESRGENPFQ